MQTASNVDDDHPLARELGSLRSALAHYQHVSHTSQVQIQRHSLEATFAADRVKSLEQENLRLLDEISVLRANPDITPSAATLQVSELSLALRRVSDKLSQAEATLLERTTELAHAVSAKSRSQKECLSLRDSLRSMTTKLSEVKRRERERSIRERVVEEELKMVNFALQEYADLVRSFEGRTSSSRGPVSTTTDGQSIRQNLVGHTSALHALAQEFRDTTSQLEDEIATLRTEIENLHLSLNIQGKIGEEERTELAHVKAGLERSQTDDRAAAKLVTRYMKFSQSSTDMLQNTIANLKKRYAASTGNLVAQVDELQYHLSVEKRRSDSLRNALNELSEDVSRESYGRRREISIRLSLLAREERMVEGLQRWKRKAEETLQRKLAHAGALTDPTDSTSGIETVISEANRLLLSLDGPFAISTGDGVEGAWSGSFTRIIAAEEAVQSLLAELQIETDKRLALERWRMVHNDHVSFESSLSIPTSFASDGSKSNIRPLPSQPPQSVEGHTESIGLDQDGAGPPNMAIFPLNIPIQTVSAEGASPPHPSSASVDITSHTIFSAADSRYGDFPRTSLHADFEAEVPANLPLPVSPVSDGSIRPLDPEPSASGHSEAGSLVSNVVEPFMPTSPIQNATQEQGASIFLELEVTEFTQSEPDASRPSSKSDNMSSPPWVAGVTQDTLIPLTPLTGDIMIQPTCTGEERVAAITVHTSPNNSPSSIPGAQGLLEQLERVLHRYDSVQRTFRDCHVALTTLKSDLIRQPSASQSTTTNPDVFRNAVGRLEDFCEDARVELEIRVADEARLARGYETVCSVPGALADQWERENLMEGFTAFVEGTSESIVKAQETFKRKLDDLHHDIAALKLAIHESVSERIIDEGKLPVSEQHTGTGHGWSSWTPTFLSPSRPPSPSPSATFGTVITSHHQGTSSQLLPSSADPYARLGLRISMPSNSHRHHSPLFPTAPFLPRNRTVSTSRLPTVGGFLQPSPHFERPRSTSGMHFVGLGGIVSRSKLSLGSDSSGVLKNGLEKGMNGVSEVE